MESGSKPLVGRELGVKRPFGRAFVGNVALVLDFSGLQVNFWTILYRLRI